MDKLKSEMAVVKLLVIRFGIAIDGDDLAGRIDGYPERFRTKRARKILTFKNNQLFDRESDLVPYVPEELYLLVGSRTSVVKVNYREDSEFRLLQGDGLRIVCDVLGRSWQAKLSIRPRISSLTIGGFPADDFVQILGADRVAVLGYDGCNEFYIGKQCLFCDSNPLRLGERSCRPTLNQLHCDFDRNISLWLESASSYQQYCQKAYRLLLEHGGIGPHLHLHIMAG